ncbi:unnamed protein product, partial [Closterium sp. NIES-64]
MAVHFRNGGERALGKFPTASYNQRLAHWERAARHTVLRAALVARSRHSFRIRRVPHLSPLQ